MKKSVRRGILLEFNVSENSYKQNFTVKTNNNCMRNKIHNLYNNLSMIQISEGTGQKIQVCLLKCRRSKVYSHLYQG